VLPLGPREKLPLARLVPNGVVNATTDEHTLRKWWAKVPTANIGISCESLLVVDIDGRNGGYATLEAIEAEHGGFVGCPTVATGSGGTHYFFTLPNDELRGKLGAGIDLVHGRNRYVVAAPSVHPNGQEYRWTSARGVTVTRPPDWLLELSRRPPPTPLPPRATGSDAVERCRRYLAKCDPAVAGANGHNHTFKICRFVVEKFELSADDALSLLLEWNTQCLPPWTTAEPSRKLRHALSR
jgi:hypothetical protein